MSDHRGEESKRQKNLVTQLELHKNQLLMEKQGLTLERFAALTSLLEEKDRLLDERSSVIGGLMAHIHRTQQALEQEKENFERMKLQMEKQLHDLEAEKQKCDQKVETQHLRSYNQDLKSQLVMKKKQLEETRQKLFQIDSLNQTLTLNERSNHEELRTAKAEAMNCLLNMDGNGTNIGVKRMGVIDPLPFQDACLKKFCGENQEENFKKLYFSWNGNLSDASWNPFKKEVISGKLTEVVDENNKRLMELRKEWGDEAYRAVVNALTELLEYSPGLRPTPVLWNYNEGRKAHLKEVIQYIIQQWEACKKKDGENSATIANLIVEKESLTTRLTNISALVREKDRILSEKYAAFGKLTAEDAKKVKLIDNMSATVSTLTANNDVLLENFKKEMRKTQRMKNRIEKLKHELQQKEELGKQRKQLTQKEGDNDKGKGIVAIKIESIESMDCICCGPLLDQVEPLSKNLEGYKAWKAQESSAAEDEMLQDQNMMTSIKELQPKPKPDMIEEQQEERSNIARVSQPTQTLNSLRTIVSSPSLVMMQERNEFFLTIFQLQELELKTPRSKLMHFFDIFVLIGICFGGCSFSHGMRKRSQSKGRDLKR